MLTNLVDLDWFVAIEIQVIFFILTSTGIVLLLMPV